MIQTNLHALALVPINPDEKLRIAGMADAVGDAMSSILRQTLFLCYHPQPLPADRQLHIESRVLVRPVVLPEDGGGPIHAALALHEGRQDVADVADLVAWVSL